MMMQRFILFFLLLFSFWTLIGQDRFNISGVVLDDIEEPLPYVNVVLYKDAEVITGVTTDFDGKYSFTVPPGQYTVKYDYVGFTSIIKTGIIVDEKDIQINDVIMSSQDVLLKPIIYLYPEEKTEVTVKLNYAGELLFTYPKYPEEGWTCTAYPDGTLIDENNKEYYALFWEGTPYKQLSIGEEGFVIKGSETVSFLEASLATLGLNRREAMEFIIFWQPKMEKNAYNLIHFSTEEYEQLAVLEVTPKPNTVIRVMMVFQPLISPVDIAPQDLSQLKKERNGFTLVEWGGTMVKPHLSQR